MGPLSFKRNWTPPIGLTTCNTGRHKRMISLPINGSKAGTKVFPTTDRSSFKHFRRRKKKLKA